MALLQVPRGDELQSLQTTLDSGSSDADVESAKMSGDVPGQSFAQRRKRSVVIGGALIASLGALAVIVAHKGGDAKPYAVVNVGGLEAKAQAALTMPTAQSAPAAPTMQGVPAAAAAPVPTQSTQSVPVAPTTQVVPAAAGAPLSTQPAQSLPVASNTQLASAAFGAPASTQSAEIVPAATAAPSVSTTSSSYVPKASDVIPAEKQNDNDPCDSYKEEVHDGLCYKQCKTLTNGAYPYRLNAFCCCTEKHCTLADFFKDTTKCPTFEPCANGGYDVDADGKACPHPEGACYKDEETLIGACYMKCSLLTNGKYPHRVGPDTCCKSSSDLACLNPFNDKTSPKFGVGGGKGDGNPGTKAGVHEPITGLTMS